MSLRCNTGTGTRLARSGAPSNVRRAPCTPPSGLESDPAIASAAEILPGSTCEACLLGGLAHCRSSARRLGRSAGRPPPPKPVLLPVATGAESSRVRKAGNRPSILVGSSSAVTAAIGAPATTGVKFRPPLQLEDTGVAATALRGTLSAPTAVVSHEARAW